ncbi:hypothetical protein [Noviherbaspirillum humi]|uniref:hypothetical protein n=1 Tax=Noviherbaspirillum humi TaxID=1688639 RepID=UPI001C3C856F
MDAASCDLPGVAPAAGFSLAALLFAVERDVDLAADFTAVFGAVSAVSACG